MVLKAYYGSRSVCCVSNHLTPGVINVHARGLQTRPVNPCPALTEFTHTPAARPAALQDASICHKRISYDSHARREASKGAHVSQYLELFKQSHTE